jgi:hypothetical protein
MDVKYYECHVTLEPVFGGRLESLKELAASHGFKPAKLLMQKRAESTPERSNKDTFCTGHSKSFDDIKERMNALTEALRNAGFAVWRRKIEAVVFDERLV